MFSGVAAARSLACQTHPAGASASSAPNCWPRAPFVVADTRAVKSHWTQVKHLERGRDWAARRSFSSGRQQRPARTIGLVEVNNKTKELLLVALCVQLSFERFCQARSSSSALGARSPPALSIFNQHKQTNTRLHVHNLPIFTQKIINIKYYLLST